MSCNFNRDTLEAYALGLLDGDAKQKTARHIGNCADCKAFVVERRNSMYLLERSFDEEVPEWLASRTLAELKHRNTASGFRRFLVPLSVLSGAAALVALLFMLPGLQTGRQYFMKQTKVHSLSMNSPEKAERTTSRSQSEAHGGIVYSTAEGSIADSFNHDNNAVPNAGLLVGLHFDNPVADRSIYDNLGISEEIAALLL